MSGNWRPNKAEREELSERMDYPSPARAEPIVILQQSEPNIINIDGLLDPDLDAMVKAQHDAPSISVVLLVQILRELKKAAAPKQAGGLPDPPYIPPAYDYR